MDKYELAAAAPQTSAFSLIKALLGALIARLIWDIIF